jgi:hypothetical protein
VNVFPSAPDSGATNRFVLETHCRRDNSNGFAGRITTPQLDDKFLCQHSARVFLAAIAPLTLDLVRDIVGVSADSEVRRINAPRIVAIVADDFTRRNRTVGKSPCGAMALPSVRTELESTISLFVHGAIPRPTLVDPELARRKRERVGKSETVRTFRPNRPIDALASPLSLVMRLAKPAVQHDAIANR